MSSSHFPSGKWWWAGIAVIVLAALIRFWQLGIVPHGMAWDEAAIGYNGYAVITTRRDEWLVRLPVSFKSFGDYKAPLAIYLNGIGTYVFGMHLWVVRLPFAVAGVVTVFGVMWLVYELFYSLRKSHWWAESETAQRSLTIVSGVLAALSIWHVHYSRVAFESGMALMWVVLAAASLLKVCQEKMKWQWQAFWALFCTVCSVASLYTYHSAKIVMPLILLGLAVWQWKAVLSQLKVWIVMAVIALGLAWPLVQDSLWGTGNERWEQASYMAKEGNAGEKIARFGQQMVVHFSPAFLLQGWTDTLRHGDGEHGVLSVIEFIFIIIALIGLITAMQKEDELRSLSLFAIWWIVIGFVPAALGVDIPHSNRALLALPGFVILTLIGLQRSIEWLKHTKYLEKIRGTHHERDIVVKSLVGTTALLFSLSFMAYFHTYFTTYAASSTDAFKDGYLEALEWVIPYEKGLDGKQKVDQIIFTTDYGQAYIYALFARRTNPIWYQGGALNTYLFTDAVAESDLLRPNTIVVASGTDPGELEKADHVVYGKDGTVRFKIFRNQ